MCAVHTIFKGITERESKCLSCEKFIKYQRKRKNAVKNEYKHLLAQNINFILEEDFIKFMTLTIIGVASVVAY